MRRSRPKLRVSDSILRSHGKVKEGEEAEADIEVAEAISHEGAVLIHIEGLIAAEVASPVHRMVVRVVESRDLTIGLRKLQWQESRRERREMRPCGNIYLLVSGVAP